MLLIDRILDHFVRHSVFSKSYVSKLKGFIYIITKPVTRTCELCCNENGNVCWAVLSSSNAVHLYSGGAWFESQLRASYPSRLKFFILATVSPGKCQDSTSIRSRPLPTNFFQFFIHKSSYHSTQYTLHIDGVVKHPTKGEGVRVYSVM
jgi:hypothetical protein